MIGEAYKIIIVKTSQIMDRSLNLTYKGAVIREKERMMTYMKIENIKNVRIDAMLGTNPLIAKKNAITKRFIKKIKVALMVEAKIIVQRGT